MSTDHSREISTAAHDQAARTPEIALVGHNDASLALNGLNVESGRVGILHSLPKSVEIVVGNDLRKDIRPRGEPFRPNDQSIGQALGTGLNQ